MKTKTTGLLAFVLAGAIPAVAHAQSTGGDAPLPAETVKANTATKGSTDVAKSGFATGALPAADDAHDVTTAAVSAGGLFSSGNSRTLALTSSGKFKLRRDEHQFSAAASANFARAGKAAEKVETTVENYQGLLRYDYFLNDNLALFLQSSLRRDRFQGLDLRLNIDPGLAYYVVNTKKQTLRAELGYDLQHDVRRDADRDLPIPAGSPAGTQAVLLDKTQTLNNGRVFFGYENKLYEQVSFVTSLEYLQNLSNFNRYRMIFDVGLSTNIAEKFAIATTYTMRFENRPLPSVQKADSIASINLVYTLF